MSALGRRAARSEFVWVWYATVALFVVSAVVSPATVRGDAIRLMVPFAAILAIAAVGQTLVIRQRGIDLSVAGVMSLSGIVASKIAAEHHLAVIPAIVVTLLVCLVIGIVTGLIVTRLGITPLVTTLATNALLLGAIQSYSGGVPIGAPKALNRFALGTVLGVPDTALVAVVVVAIASAVIGGTTFGRRFVAVGENAETARVAGVGVLRYQVATYGLAAVCFGTAGILLAGYVATAIPNAGDSYLLSVIAAVVVGGTPFTGGRGSVVASVVAAVFLSQLLALVLALGAPSSTQFLVQSAAIALATGFRHLRIPGGLRRHAVLEGTP
jgi:ribose transport system permease protein